MTEHTATAENKRPFLPREGDTLLKALEDIELRATQDKIASTIGRMSAIKRADFLQGALERIACAARAAITKAQGGE